MNYLDQKKGFLGFDANHKSEAKVVVVPFGLEKTVSYGSGTKNGPKEIIKASHQVELFDEELNKEPYKEIGIKTIKPFAIKKEIRKALDQISNINEKIIKMIEKNKSLRVFLKLFKNLQLRLLIALKKHGKIFQVIKKA